jgi:hypothetical protein
VDGWEDDDVKRPDLGETGELVEGDDWVGMGWS